MPLAVSESGKAIVAGVNQSATDGIVSDRIDHRSVNAIVSVVRFLELRESLVCEDATGGKQKGESKDSGPKYRSHAVPKHPRHSWIVGISQELHCCAMLLLKATCFFANLITELLTFH
jgi:hypothetical protein